MAIDNFIVRNSHSNLNTINAKKGTDIQSLKEIHIDYNVPRLSCSLSIDSKSALKLPAPNPRAPIR